MVQLSPFPTPPPECSEVGGDGQEGPGEAHSPKVGSPSDLSTLQLNFEVATAYYGYETYIEDGLICLKHKVRNLEKKKLKLEDYKKRLSKGESLNHDQMVAVEKYDEVLHHLGFAQELHKTLDCLTQNLLRAQKKVLKKEQMVKVEAERRRLSTVLQFHHLLHGLQQEHIRKDLLDGCNKAPRISEQQLHSLSQLAGLLGVKRDTQMSLEEQMDQAALTYLDLLEGKDKPVVGSTFKLLKEELTRLLNCNYISCLPLPPNNCPKVVLSSTSKSSISKSKPNDISKENWKNDFRDMREQEPPDCWDVEFSDGASSPKATANKTLRGAATFIPKVPCTTKRQSAECKKRKERTKGAKHAKLAVHMSMPVGVFDLPSTLPEDPILRKQCLEDLMKTFHSSFSFIQDSLLDGVVSPTNSHSRLRRQQSGSSSSLSHTDLINPGDLHPKTMQSTPLPTRLMERKASLTNGDPFHQACDMELTSEALPHEPLQLAERTKFPSPPLYRRESISVGLKDKSRPHTPVSQPGEQSQSLCNGEPSRTSTPPLGQTPSIPPTRQTLTSAQFQKIQSVFHENASLPQNGETNYKKDIAVFPEPRYVTASTQTLPVFGTSEDEPQSVYHSDYTAGNGGETFLSPGQSSGSASRLGQSYYNNGSVRGTARGNRGLALTFRSSGWHRGRSYVPQTHFRDPVFYADRDSGYLHIYRPGGGRHNSSAAWSDSSQVSSPDREAAFVSMDLGPVDYLSVSTMEVPVTPHGPRHTALLPRQLFPLSQPLRVAFTASRTANFAPGNLDQPIVFDHLLTNLGEMYDGHIGRFTCPVNGTYFFSFSILKLAINMPLYINLMRNEEVMVSAYANDGAPDHETASNQATLPLFQGDQVWLRLHRGAIYGSTWNYSTFSGFLLYQD